MIFEIILIGIIFAYLMKSFDILVAFKEVNINISVKDSIKIRLLITNNYLKLRKNTLINKKKLTSAYLLHFNALLVFLTSLVQDATLAVNEHKIAIVSIQKQDNITDIVKKLLPIINNKKFNVIF